MSFSAQRRRTPDKCILPILKPIMCGPIYCRCAALCSLCTRRRSGGGAAEHTQGKDRHVVRRTRKRQQAKEHGARARTPRRATARVTSSTRGRRPAACCAVIVVVASRPRPICSPQTTRTHTRARRESITHTRTHRHPSRKVSSPPGPGLPSSLSSPSQTSPRRWISASPTRPPARPRVGRGMGLLGRRTLLRLLALASAAVAVAVTVEAYEGDADPLYRCEIPPPCLLRCLPSHAAWSRSLASAPLPRAAFPFYP
jgi:hypothetical protein